MPFSSIILNKRFQEFINTIIKKNPTILNDDPINTSSLKISIVNYFYILMNEIGLGQFGYLNMIISNLYLPFMSKIPNPDLNNISTYYYTMNHIIDYIIPIVRKFTKNNKFNAELYYKNVFVKNVDIWGFVMCYEKYLSFLGYNNLPENNQLKKHDNKNLYMLLRDIYINILFSNPTEPIDTTKLIEKLKQLNKLFVNIKKVTFNTPLKQVTEKKTRKIKYTPYPTLKSTYSRSMSETSTPSIDYTLKELSKNFKRTRSRTQRSKTQRSKTQRSKTRRHRNKPYHVTKSSLYTNRELDKLFNL